MRITLQYFDGCPNWKLMEQRLAQSLVDGQVVGDEMVRERVESPEEAVRLGFRGSPTVLIAVSRSPSSVISLVADFGTHSALHP